MPGILQLEPSGELTFRGPFKDVVRSELRLKNPTSSTIAFKVKTTAPKLYCVKPNIGVVEPNDQIAVQVMLQPFDFDPEKPVRHKFLVQSFIAEDVGVAHVNDQVWRDVPAEKIMEDKLRCSLERGDFENDGATGSANVGQHEPDTNSAQVLRQELQVLRTENTKLKKDYQELLLRQRSSKYESPMVTGKTSKDTAIAAQASYVSMKTRLFFAALMIAFGILISRTIF